MADFFDQLCEDIEAYSSEILKNTASEVADEMTFTAYDAIERFYDDYPPKESGMSEPLEYIRHYYNFMENSFKRFTHNNRNVVYSGGVELSSEWLDSIYNGTTEQVFTAVYMGFHGLPLAFTPVMDPSPYELIFKKCEDIYHNPDYYISLGIKKANQKKYVIL